MTRNSTKSTARLLAEYILTVLIYLAFPVIFITGCILLSEDYPIPGCLLMLIPPAVLVTILGTIACRYGWRRKKKEARQLADIESAGTQMERTVNSASVRKVDEPLVNSNPVSARPAAKENDNVQVCGMLVALDRLLTCTVKDELEMPPPVYASDDHRFMISQRA
jgi:hypothetical protein